MRLPVRVVAETLTTLSSLNGGAGIPGVGIQVLGSHSRSHEPRAVFLLRSGSFLQKKGLV